MPKQESLNTLKTPRRAATCTTSATTTKPTGECLCLDISFCRRESLNGHACALMQDLMWTVWSVALLWPYEGMDYVYEYVISDTAQVKLGMLSFYFDSTANNFFQFQV